MGWQSGPMPWRDTCIQTFSGSKEPLQKLGVPELWGLKLDENEGKSGVRNPFGPDLVLTWSWKWMTWWLGEKLTVSDGRDWLSAPRLLQDLMIIDFMRRSMNDYQTCGCTYSDISHSWCIWPQSRFGEFIQMTNWRPRLGALIKTWTSVLTVESQLVGTFDATNGSPDNRKGLLHVWALLLDDQYRSGRCTKDTARTHKEGAKTSDKCREMKI